jgi:hypothetical protein
MASKPIIRGAERARSREGTGEFNHGASRRGKLFYDRNMKYTAPSRQRPAYRKSSFNGCFM